MDVLKSNMYQFNQKQTANGLDLLSTINDKAVAACFFDPQYRGLLDKLKYGNEGSKESARCNLTQMDDATIIKFIKAMDRVLQDSGHLFLWVDKFHLCEGDVKRWIKGTNLVQVDLLTWDKQKFGLGCRLRSTTEFLIVLQKLPKRAKGVWTDHSIPDDWPEKVNNKIHPHEKPLDLQARLICAVTNDNDVVVDAAAGSYSVLEACKLTNRNFYGCDIQFGDDCKKF